MSGAPCTDPGCRGCQPVVMPDGQVTYYCPAIRVSLLCTVRRVGPKPNCPGVDATPPRAARPERKRPERKRPERKRPGRKARPEPAPTVAEPRPAGRPSKARPGKARPGKARPEPAPTVAEPRPAGRPAPAPSPAASAAPGRTVGEGLDALGRGALYVGGALVALVALGLAVEVGAALAGMVGTVLAVLALLGLAALVVPVAWVVVTEGVDWPAVARRAATTRALVRARLARPAPADALAIEPAAPPAQSVAAWTTGPAGPERVTREDVERVHAERVVR